MIRTHADGVHVFRDGASSFGDGAEVCFEKFGMAPRLASKGVCEDVPRFLGGGSASNKGYNGRVKSANECTEQKLILTNPSKVRRIGLRGGRGRGSRDVRGWSRKGAIKIFEEAVANKRGLKLKFPGEIICGGEFEDVGEGGHHKRMTGFGIVRNSGVCHGEKKMRKQPALIP